MGYAKTLFRFAWLFVLFAAMVAPRVYGETTGTNGKNATVTKINGFLEQSGYSYMKISSEAWLIKRQGKNIPDMNILVGTGDELIVVGVVVAQKDNVKVTADSMASMLRLANDIDYVKIGIDNDGDLFVRSEIKTAKLDLQDFKSSVEDIFAAADRTYAVIRPYLNVP